MTSKINFKKIWALLIALVMMVSVFSLCDGSGETTTTGGSTSTTAGETTSDDHGHDHDEDENKSWAAQHLSFLIAIGIIVLIVGVYFVLRLFVPSFREKTSKFWNSS